MDVIKHLNNCDYFVISRRIRLSEGVHILARNIRANFTLEQTAEGQKGSVSTVLLLNLGARWGVSGQGHVLVALPPGKRNATPCTRGWVGPRARLDGSENIAPTGIVSACTVTNQQIMYKIVKCKAIPLTAWTGPVGSRMLRHMKVVRLSALRTGRLYPQVVFLVLISVRG